jgi:hypothetical protein
MITIRVECADVTSFDCDVLLLKYAQRFYGADGVVAAALGPKPFERFEVRQNEYKILRRPAAGWTIAARNVVFVGVPPLELFDYGEIRRFSLRGLRAISEHLKTSRNVATTIHGVGFGLDEGEAFRAQLAGIADFEKDEPDPLNLTFVELDQRRANRLNAMLEHAETQARPSDVAQGASRAGFGTEVTNAGLESDRKEHVFVAMPFGEEMLDVYELAIKEAAHGAGFLCVRVDQEVFTGDILVMIKERIMSAALVVADLTNANPNVYLEVGYSWASNRPTVLVARQGSKIGFDLQGHRCVLYKNLVELKGKLEKELLSLRASGKYQSPTLQSKR